ncbi:integrase protein [Leptolyngbya sp. NIES-3755]|nr:integrase protein [Leptolyngbya sp. NIES-3755]
MGILATYGLRPHEAFRLDFDALKQCDRIVQVQRNTKTGKRQVWAYHPEWFEAFHLEHVQLPSIDLNRPNEAIGRSVNHYFRDANVPFNPMLLRHRWAIRSLEYGLDYKLAARMMGHSYIVHERIYHRWIDRTVLQSAYDRSLENHQVPPLPKDSDKS